ncbi:hypothetical protein CJ030_MR2G011926 [Morella rubra]|uniref:F-box domain-containing protein n=1 Tax=Morella rubra TaxID=262757 RepID=A0A6A1UR70_9ROSI|nr:hypothetical protein CJ030_MR8G020276 [Morella rubra]KAB1223189.1 hypothetical protein CJ030_MR2G011926 [Morella rubra]
MRPTKRSPRTLPEELWSEVISRIIRDNPKEWQSLCLVSKQFYQAAHGPTVYRRLRIEDIPPQYPQPKSGKPSATNVTRAKTHMKFSSEVATKCTGTQQSKKDSRKSTLWQRGEIQRENTFSPWPITIKEETQDRLS